MLVGKSKTVLPSDNRQSIIDFIGVVSRGLKLWKIEFEVHSKKFYDFEKMNEKAKKIHYENE